MYMLCINASETGSWSQTDKVGCPFSPGCQHEFQRVLTKPLADAHRTPEEKADLYHCETALGTTARISLSWTKTRLKVGGANQIAATSTYYIYRFICTVQVMERSQDKPDPPEITSDFQSSWETWSSISNPSENAENSFWSKIITTFQLFITNGHLLFSPKVKKSRLAPWTDVELHP